MAVHQCETVTNMSCEQAQGKSQMYLGKSFTSSVCSLTDTVIMFE